ncbi:MAG TPA: sigma-54 dependent transcriptional regulator [bacterium]|nr:sigma-54 dependent transcriptional regulator [bacterium]
MVRGKQPARIMVADDEKLMNDFIREILRRKGYEVDQAFDGKTATRLLAERSYDLVITDKRMPGADGIEVLQAAAKCQPAAKVIVMTAYGSVEGAVEAMRLGAFDYVMKPFDANQIEETVDRALEEAPERRPHSPCDLAVVGTGERMQEVLELVRVVAPTTSTVLITGETGTGKELIAREIQRLSKRSDGPFIRLNCAALPDGLIESELFGHEKGSFTGALRTKMGKFELADGGTLLLDEIGEIGSQMQAKILRVLQEREFERVGAQETLRVNVRIIATTNTNLASAMEEGRFREDLYYRLSVFPINLPPLRDRREDIPVLVDHFIQKYRSLCDGRIIGIDDAALAALVGHGWPGNVRELENCMERAMIMGRGPLITKDDIVSPVVASRKDTTSLDPGISLREMEKMLVLKTLESVGWNRTLAARKLGISTRTLRNKLKIYKEEDISPYAEKPSTLDEAAKELACTP